MGARPGSLKRVGGTQSVAAQYAGVGYAQQGRQAALGKPGGGINGMFTPPIAPACILPTPAPHARVRRRIHPLHPFRRFMR
jgi:hypothetical protein